MNKENPRNQTTVTIDIETNKALISYCKKYKITKKNFIEKALNYFLLQGIDINNPPQKMDVDRLLKRIEDSIKITKNIEQKILLPMNTDILKNTDLTVDTNAKISLFIDFMTQNQSKR